MTWASNTLSVNAFDRALAMKVDGKKRFLLQWEHYGSIGAVVVWATDEKEALDICDAKARAQYERERRLIAREYDPITDGDVIHE